MIHDICEGLCSEGGILVQDTQFVLHVKCLVLGTSCLQSLSGTLYKTDSLCHSNPDSRNPC
jgi:hypothetical protein